MSPFGLNHHGRGQGRGGRGQPLCPKAEAALPPQQSPAATPLVASGSTHCASRSQSLWLQHNTCPSSMAPSPTWRGRRCPQPVGSVNPHGQHSTSTSHMCFSRPSLPPHAVPHPHATDKGGAPAAACCPLQAKVRSLTWYPHVHTTGTHGQAGLCLRPPPTSTCGGPSLGLTQLVGEGALWQGAGVHTPLGETHLPPRPPV